MSSPPPNYATLKYIEMYRNCIMELWPHLIGDMLHVELLNRSYDILNFIANLGLLLILFYKPNPFRFWL